MVKLTIDLVENSCAFINPLKEREMDLRGFSWLIYSGRLTRRFL
jgi:hypothetical protein